MKIKENTPTITYIMIDTENKSKQQLIDEVVEKVNRSCTSLLKKYSKIINHEKYINVENDIEKEKIKMIKQFVYQIHHMDEINRATLADMVLDF